MKLFKICVCLSVVLVVGCDPGTPSGSTEFRSTGYSAALTQIEFNNLPPEKQYEVANKLLGTMFRGVPVEDFFDISSGTSTLTLKPAAATFLNDTRKNLTTKVGGTVIKDIDAVIDGLDEKGIRDTALTPKYVFDGNGNVEDNQRPRQLPLARIKEYPLSKEFFSNWMAYFLANTIMFSPAFETETVDMDDVRNINALLVSNLSLDKGVRDIIRSHLPTQARWRVSRSPENHALEAYELYLGLFEDTEEDSLRGGIACQNIYLTTEAEGYILRQTDFFNTTSQLILDQYYITSCNDLYDVIAGHPLVMPRAIEVIVNYIMSGRNEQDRLRMIDSIASSGAETFEDIFLSIIFSREYLIKTERVKSFEENLLPLLDILKWNPAANADEMDERIFIRMASDTNNRINLNRMGWNTMSLKIGRIPDVPLDVLSFSNYHKAMREEFLMGDASQNSDSFRGGNGVSGLFYDEAGNLRAELGGLSINEFIDFLFLSALQHTASDVEKADLLPIYGTYITQDATGTDIIQVGRYDEVAAITFDYISRLPEFYYFKAVN